jgi:Domain of unknown function (DUF4124)
MLRTVAISSILFAGTVSVAYADVYRWVDEHGGVHYSDQWVAGSEVIKSSKSHSSADTPRPDTTTKPLAAPAPADAGDKNAAAVKQDMAKVREQQCKDAKERYDKAIIARRIYKPKDDSKDGSKDGDDREYLSEEEADAYRVKARQEMVDLCGSSASATKSPE